VPLTLEKHNGKLHDPALCEQLPVRDYLDGVVVRTNGSFVAGYELKGLTSYFASDEGRDRGKLMVEALLRSLPEQSMRVQFRYEVVENLGELLEQYIAGQRCERNEAIVLDDLRVDRWKTRPASSAPLFHLGRGSAPPIGRQTAQAKRRDPQPFSRKVDRTEQARAPPVAVRV
jgi:hypothetical protein